MGRKRAEFLFVRARAVRLLARANRARRERRGRLVELTLDDAQLLVFGRAERRVVAEFAANRWRPRRPWGTEWRGGQRGSRGLLQWRGLAQGASGRHSRTWRERGCIFLRKR